MLLLWLLAVDVDCVQQLPLILTLFLLLRLCRCSVSGAIEALCRCSVSGAIEALCRCSVSCAIEALKHYVGASVSGAIEALMSVQCLMVLNEALCRCSVSCAIEALKIEITWMQLSHVLSYGCYVELHVHSCADQKTLCQ